MGELSRDVLSKLGFDKCIGVQQIMEMWFCYFDGVTCD